MDTRPARLAMPRKREAQTLVDRLTKIEGGLSQRRCAWREVRQRSAPVSSGPSSLPLAAASWFFFTN